MYIGIRAKKVVRSENGKAWNLTSVLRLKKKIKDMHGK